MYTYAHGYPPFRSGIWEGKCTGGWWRGAIAWGNAGIKPFKRHHDKS